MKTICSLSHVFVLLLLFIRGVACAELASNPESKFAQEMIALPVRIIDPNGQPVEGAKVVPWALRCSQGHGAWSKDGFGASEPPKFKTDQQGQVEVRYPRYAELEERVQTTQVTLSVDHPDYAYVMYEFINIPREEAEVHEIKLQRGAAVELVPVSQGKPMPTDNLFAVWADGRNWNAESSGARRLDDALRIPSMPAGERQVLLVILNGDRATHFSSVLDLQLQEDVTLRESVEMKPAVTIRGKVDDQVPRPVKNGRVKSWTLPKAGESDEKSNIEWITWAPIAEDGTFAIDAWPADEAVQLIALCDGYLATDGAAPEEVENPRAPENDPFGRPQVFRPEEFVHEIVVPMEPLVACELQVLDQLGKPIEGVKVESWPNVGWWNHGSQIYGWPLVRCEKMVRVRDYRKARDTVFPQPFKTKTDKEGRGMLLLPTGNQDLTVQHDNYELPIDRGSRHVEVHLHAGKVTNTMLKLQPKGAEYLGEWDRLAGVLFGCTGEECRRLLEDKGFRKRMENVRKRYEQSDDPQDPEMLNDVFGEIANAFEKLDDEQAEVERWRKKAAEQKQKIEHGSTPER